MNEYAFLAPWMPHLMLAPIVLPLLTAAVMLLMREEQQRAKLVLGVASTLLGLVVAVGLLAWASQLGEPATMGVYLPGNWPAPFGIVLALDRLAALMLVLTSVLGLAAALYAAAGWHRAGVHYHPLFQFQLMGLAGAFLTGDLFILFVFFEIMLAASYGLLLHGSGKARVQAGLHFIAINLAASSLFLIGVSMLYGLTGTLNMADLAQSMAQVQDSDRGLLHAAAAILATAFLIKAAVWPLNFWLVPAYSAATAPVGALFLLSDLIDRWRDQETSGLPYEPRADEAPFLNAELVPTPGLNLDDNEAVLVGEAIPAAAAFLGLAFMVTTLLVAGLPPLSGFVGKVAMLTALLNPLGLGSSAGHQPGLAGWAFVALLIGCGLLALLALTRAGIRHFWSAHDRPLPQLRLMEGLPVAGLLLACAALAVLAEPAMRYTQATADALHTPGTYVRAVLSAQPVPSPHTAGAAGAAGTTGKAGAAAAGGAPARPLTDHNNGSAAAAAASPPTFARERP